MAVSSSDMQTVAEEIRAVGRWLSRSRVTRRTTDARLLTPAEQRVASIFAARYGVAGERNTILQTIGDQHGLTRERIRQIVEKLAQRSGQLKIPTPCIDRLAVEIRPSLPATLGVLDNQFRWLLGEALSIESVARFCREILGRNVISLTDRPANMVAPWEPTVIDPQTHDPERLRVLRDVASRMIRSCGAAQILYVTGAASEVMDRAILPRDAMRDCSMIPGFEWLCEREGWFWFGEVPDNRLVSVARKILVAARQRVDAEEILTGLVRSRRHYYPQGRQNPYLIEPPLKVVIEVLSRTNGFRTIQYDDFVMESPESEEAVLSDAELAIVGALRANGNTASRYLLNTLLVKQGPLGHMALQVSLDTSPIFRHLEFGVFALRGAAIDAKCLAAAKSMVGGEGRNRTELQVDGNGCYRLAFILSEYATKVRFWDIPSVLTEVMEEGEYQVEGFDEPVTYVCLSGGARRLRRFISKLGSLGFTPGDEVVLVVKPEARRIWIEKSSSR